MLLLLWLCLLCLRRRLWDWEGLFLGVLLHRRGLLMRRWIVVDMSKILRVVRDLGRSLLLWNALVLGITTGRCSGSWATRRCVV